MTKIELSRTVFRYINMPERWEREEKIHKDLRIEKPFKKSPDVNAICPMCKAQDTPPQTDVVVLNDILAIIPNSFILKNCYECYICKYIWSVTEKTACNR